MATTTTSPRPMSDKQTRFCEEYLVDCNASAAARRAGYSAATSDRIGHENLRKPEIMTTIQKLMAARSEKTGITAERVIQEFANIAFFSVNEVMEFDGQTLTIKSFQELTPAQISVISSIKPIWDRGDKDNGPSVMGYEVKFYDKISALGALLKHTAGIDPTDTGNEATTALGRLLQAGLDTQRKNGTLKRR